MDKSDLVKFRSECIAAHNFYRSLHGTTPLVWSARLADGAQKWAEQLASADSLTYSHERGLGENIACLWGSEVTGNKVTQIWYEESQNYDYSLPRVTPNTRPFCQVVWEGTRELGAGKASTKNGKQVVVARYNPPATRKQVEKNVKSPKLDKIDGSTALATKESLGLRKFQEECLFAHNEFRVLHGAPPLHWSPSLAWAAQQWAEQLVQIGELKHNNDEMVGENLAGMVGDDLTGKECTDMWYEEVNDFDFENPGYSEETSNFSQVVWIGSELFGVGRASLGNTCIVVAFYEPPGNIEGLFGANVRLQGTRVKTYRLNKEMKTFIPPSPDLEWFRIECLVAHNYFRARHGAPPLVIGQTLNEEAQYWAERLLVTGATEDLQESRIGINVAIIHGHHVSGLKITELWYDEGTGYNFDSPGFSLSTRSFTQLIWLTSRKLGVGKATNNSGQCVVVARYEPVGNIDGLFVSNVRQRGHERNGREPMLFESDLKYRIKVEGRRSFRMSWEIEGTQTLQAVDKAREKNRRKEQAQPAYLSSPETFTRLVWIESPVLPRKQMRESCDLEVDKSDEDKESGVEEGEEFEQEEPNFLVVQHTAAEAAGIGGKDLERAIVYSEPSHTYSYPDVRRSLSLDSEGTEPEPEEGRVLSRVAYFEHFDKIEKENKFDRPKRTSIELKTQLQHEQLEDTEAKTHKISEHEETVCQLEYDDVFPKHDENDERDDDFASEEEVEEDDDDVMSLETVSEAEEDLLAELDEFEMDHHIKSYCYEENYVREEDEVREKTIDEGEGADITENELKGKDNEGICTDPDHFVASTVDRDESVREQMRCLDNVFEFVPLTVEKQRKDDVNFDETEEEKELFKYETKPIQEERPSGQLYIEKIDSQNREQLELNFGELFSKLDKPKEKPPPTLPKPKRRPKEDLSTETKTKITQTLESKQTLETIHQAESEPAPVATQKEETVQNLKVVTEEKPTETELKEQDEDRDNGLAPDEDEFESFEVLEIDRERKMNNIFKRLNRRIQLLPTSETQPTREFDRNIDLSENTEEQELFRVYEAPASYKIGDKDPVQEDTIYADVKKRNVESEISFEEMFKRLERGEESPTKEPILKDREEPTEDLAVLESEIVEEEHSQEEKKKAVRFDKTVVVQEHETVHKELIELKEEGTASDENQYCEGESAQDVQDHCDEYEEVEEAETDDLKQITQESFVYLSHEVQESKIVADTDDQEEEQAESFEEEDELQTSVSPIKKEESPVHFSEELSEYNNAYGTCNIDTVEPADSVADVYEDYETIPVKYISEASCSQPIHVAADVDNKPLESGVQEKSVRTSMCESFEEVLPEASASSIIEPSTCYVAAELSLHETEVEPVREEVEVDELLADEEPESTNKIAVYGIPEITESTVCITTETTFHHRTEIVQKCAPSIEVEKPFETQNSVEEEASYKEILTNGHCTSVQISHDNAKELLLKDEGLSEGEIPESYQAEKIIKEAVDEKKEEVVEQLEEPEPVVEVVEETVEKKEEVVVQLEEPEPVVENVETEGEREEEVEQLEEPELVVEDVEETEKEREEEVEQLEEPEPVVEVVEETVEKKEEVVVQLEEPEPVVEDVEETEKEREEEVEQLEEPEPVVEVVEETVEKKEEVVVQLEEPEPVVEDVEETEEEREEEVEQLEEPEPVVEDVEETVEEREEVVVQLEEPEPVVEDVEETEEEREEEVEQLEEPEPVVEDVEETEEEREEEVEQLEEPEPVVEDVEETVEEREEVVVQLEEPEPVVEDVEETEEEREEEVEQLEEPEPVVEDVEETEEEREEEVEQLEEPEPVVEVVEETVEKKEEVVVQLEEPEPVVEDVEETVEEREEEVVVQLEEPEPVVEDVEETVEEREEEEIEELEEPEPVVEDVEDTVEEREEDVQLEEPERVMEDVEETVEVKEKEEKVEEIVEELENAEPETQVAEVDGIQESGEVERLQSTIVDDRFEYISEEELEETEELYERMRESFEEQDNEEEPIDEENVHIQQTAASIIHIGSQEDVNLEDFGQEPSEDEITYDSEVITEVEKEITSVLVVKESFSSTVYEDEVTHENISIEKAETESPVEETQPEALLQFVEQTEEDVPEDYNDNTDEPDLFHEDGEKFESDEVFVTDEHLQSTSITPDIEECEDLESSVEIIENKVELIQFTEEAVEHKVDEASEDDMRDEDVVGDRELLEQSSPTPDVEEEEDDLNSSDEFVEENVELIQFTEQVGEDKVIDEDFKEVVESSSESPDAVEENQSVTESRVELIQFTEQVDENKVDLVCEDEPIEQNEVHKDNAEITDDKEELIQFAEQTENQPELRLEEKYIEDEELVISERPIACSTPIFPDEKGEQMEESTSFEDSTEAGFGEKYEDMENIIGNDPSLDLSKPISLEESSGISNDEYFFQVEAEEAASKAMAEEFDDSGKLETEPEHSEELQDEKEQGSKAATTIVSTTVYEEHLTETEQTKREFIDLTPLETYEITDEGTSGEDLLSPPPIITATEFVADEEEEGSEEEYIPNFEHPRTYMVESKEVVMDPNTIESNVDKVNGDDNAQLEETKNEEKEPTPVPESETIASETSAVVKTEPEKIETETISVTLSHRTEVMGKQDSDVDDLEEKEIEERIQRKQQVMEKSLLQDEIEIREDIPEKVSTNGSMSEEKRTEVYFTSISVVKVQIENDGERIFWEEEATNKMREDELKLEEKEPTRDEMKVMKEDEALTDSAFRAERHDERQKTEDMPDEPNRGREGDEVAQVPIIPLSSSSVVAHEPSKTDTQTDKEVDYEEEVEVSKVEVSSFTEEEVPKSQLAVLSDVDFNEEIEVERVHDTEEKIQEILETDGKVDEEVAEEDVYEEEVEIQRVEHQEEGFEDENRNEEVFEEEVMIERIEEDREEEQESFPDLQPFPVYEEELDVAAEEISEDQPDDDEEDILHAEPLQEDAGEDNEEELPEEHLDAEEQDMVHAEPEQVDAGENNEVEPREEEEQAWEEYEDMDEQEQAIPQEIQGIADQGDMHLYDNNNNESLPRYYVDFSPGGSFERDSTTSDDGECPEVYRQGEPLEEDMEEFILVKYEDQSSSSGEDISDHREMYVIHEEDSEDRSEEKKEIKEESGEKTVSYDQGFVNPALEDIREEEEEDKEKQRSPNEEMDIEEKLQLEEYERLESFVILEEKLSQVESDESAEDLTSGADEKRASSEETLNDEDESSETRTSSTLKDDITSKDESGDEATSPDSHEPSELDSTLTKEVEEETIDLEDGGVLSKRTVREETYTVEEDDGDDDDNDDKDKTLTRKKVSKRVITTTTTSATHVTRIESEDHPSPAGSDNESEPRAEGEGTTSTIIVEQQPSKDMSEDIKSDKDTEERPEVDNTTSLETEEETIDLDDGGVMRKFVTREETYFVEEDKGDNNDDQLTTKTVTKKVVTTTTTSTSRVTQLEPSTSFSDDENANKVIESSSEETHTTRIKSRQPDESLASTKRQHSLENSENASAACGDPSRKRRGCIKRIDSHESEGHSSEVGSTTDSTGDSISISSEDHLSDEDFSGLDEFQIDCIRQHNIYRHQHRACRLVWSEDLAKAAATWADQLAATNTFEHSPQKESGENLACASGYDLRGDKVAEMWYDEIKDYNFEIPAFNAKCGHFTQMIWRHTKEFGVAKSIAADGTQYVVARYNPPGNVLGEFKDSIRRARGRKSIVRKRRRSSSRRQASHSSDVCDVLQREKFKNECVVSHNYYRSLHGAPPLQWSTMLANEAQTFAEKLTKSGSFMHSGNKEFGESLAFSFGLDLSGRDAVDTWYDEIVDYDYEYPGFTSHTANFTQVIWAGAKEFGMGKAIGEDGSCVVVGRYHPPGNIVGEFQENVKQKRTGYY